MAAEYIENLSIPLLAMDNQTMAKKYDFFHGQEDAADKKQRMLEYIPRHVVEQIEDFPEVCERLVQEYEQIKQDREDLRSLILKNGEDDIAVPINMHRIIQNAKAMFNVPHRQQTLLEPGYVMNKVADLLKQGIRVYPQNKIDTS